MTGAVVHGTVDPAFAAVREAFAHGQDGDAGSAQLAVYRDGRLVVDLWTGAGGADGRSVGVLMSVTKGIVATCAHVLAERGVLDLDAPVAAGWPEFAAHGKAGITLAHLLAHSSGLSGFVPERSLPALLDWDGTVRALAAMRPLWEPGTAAMYHTLTWGHLVGEVVRRATGRTTGAAVADLLARPLGLDLWIGLPEHAESRFVPQSARRPAPSDAEVAAFLARAGLDPEDPLVRATAGASQAVAASATAFNLRPFHAAEIPAANGIGDARSVARLYAALIGEVDGIRLLSPGALARAVLPRTDGQPAPAPFDGLPGPRSRFGLGYELPREGLPMLGPESFGHAGAGGRLSYAHPPTRTAVAYLCTSMAPGGPGPDPRWLPWTEALHAAVR